MFIRCLNEWTLWRVQYFMYYLLILHGLSLIKILLFGTVRGEWTIVKCNCQNFIYSSHLKTFKGEMKQNLYIIYYLG